MTGITSEECTILGGLSGGYSHSEFSQNLTTFPDKKKGKMLYLTFCRDVLLLINNKGKFSGAHNHP